MKTIEKSADFQSHIWDATSNDPLKIEELLREELTESQGIHEEICHHLLRAGGKRVRPLLVYHCGLLFGPETEDLKRTAVAAELIHMASLVHDDIIDGSDFRHNQPTAHLIWGNQRGVLAGDYLFAKAFGILAANKSTQPLRLMVGAIQNMCRGEINQDREQFSSMIGIEAYYDRIANKTAALIEASCMAGAVVAGANPLQIEAIGRFGLNLGLAFQIIDDILDLCGDEQKMGKPKYTDLIKGNLTLPVILLREQPQYKEWLREVFQEKTITNSILVEIETAAKDGGITERAFAIGVSHLDQARTVLQNFCDNQARKFLEGLTYMLQARAN
ncbi:MAG: polyprenyl synthetase family protein [Firmicutes bacterium]|nr:polyprenyl synthetase family protein [Bacillota bacterium]